MATQTHTDPASVAPLANWEELSGEELQVRIWRFEQLVAHGFARAEAVALAEDTHVELAAMRSLVGRGCPPTLAARILA